MYTSLPNFSAPLNPEVENIILLHHQSQFHLKAEQCRNKAWKQQISALYKTDAPRDNSKQKIEEFKSNIPKVRFQFTPKVAMFNAMNDATIMTYDSGADGHYFIEDDRKKAGLPIIRRSTKRVV